MKPLSIEVLWNTEETNKLEKLGIETNWDNCPEKEVTIYQLDCIIPLEQDEEEFEYSKIVTPNNEFIVRITYENLKELINNHLKS